MKKNEVSVYLESIENKYNIKFPSIFWKKSDSDEMLWLTKSYDWIRDNISELIISKSCFFSSLGDCEFIPFMYYDERVSELYESINYDKFQFVGEFWVLLQKISLINYLL